MLMTALTVLSTSNVYYRNSPISHDRIRKEKCNYNTLPLINNQPVKEGKVLFIYFLLIVFSPDRATERVPESVLTANE